MCIVNMMGIDIDKETEVFMRSQVSQVSQADQLSQSDQLRSYSFISVVICAAVLAAGFLLAVPSKAHAVPNMKNYCIVPPYVKTDIKPNLMLLLDNSDINRSWAFGEETDNSHL
ncbi:MAG TPA: hypothetical protein ENI12_05920, partial [Nitrospirae bacterium]|nr:hypothetical protein [Nitrospirota bacterium]